jgi:hypothetical protein
MRSPKLLFFSDTIECRIQNFPLRFMAAWTALTANHNLANCLRMHLQELAYLFPLQLVERCHKIIEPSQALVE